MMSDIGEMIGDLELTASIASLPGLSLDELTALPDLQTRRDRKYLVTPDRLASLLGSLNDEYRVLDIDGQRAFDYQSLYFDTPDLESYRTSVTGRRSRYKVRTRSYVGQSLATLEVKTKGLRGDTIKTRLVLSPDERATVEPSADLAAVSPSDIKLAGSLGAFVDDTLGRDVSGRLKPAVITRYRRTTIADIASLARITIDTALWCSMPSDDEQIEITDRVVVETKTAGAATAIDRMLWNIGIRPMSVSKFGLAMALSHDGLAANRWHRVLTEYCGWRSPHGAGQ